MNKSDLRNYYIDQIKNRDELIIMLNKELNDIKIKLSKNIEEINIIAAKSKGIKKRLAVNGSIKSLSGEK